MQPTFLMPLPKLHFETAIGTPLLGGKLYTYAAGTTNPKQTFTDPAGTTPHENPITLNLRGEAPAPIFWSGNYRVDLRDALGNLIYTVDNYNTDPAGLLELLKDFGTWTADMSVADVLTSVNGVNVMLLGASPTASVAVNTAAINAANTLAIQLGRPVYFPPVGVFTIGRLDPVAGNLAWYSAGRKGATVKVDTVDWPYRANSAPILDVTGSFHTHDLTYDQSWVRAIAGPPGYRDDRNPTTWGGYWFVQVTCTTTDQLQVNECHVQNMVRGFFAKAADTSKGGAQRVVFSAVTGDSIASDSQTIIAAEAAKSFLVSEGDLTTQRWTDGAAYVSNGLSAIFPWGGENVRIVDTNLIGYQMVCRGPAANPWTPGANYGVGEEFEYNHLVSYRVTTAYTSGPAFGATDTANAVVIYNPMQKLQAIGLNIDAPIADTAFYNWRKATVDDIIITSSGDMGLAASGTAYMAVSNVVVDGVRNGGLDVAGGGIVSVSNIIVKDFARASDGVYKRIDTINPNVWASNGGPNLAAVCIGLQSGTGTKQVTISNVNAYFETLPPISDGGPNNGGKVRSQVQGIYSQTSSNAAAQNTVTLSNNTVQDLEADLPNFFVAVSTLRFYSQAVTGIPQAGEIFSNGSVKFVLVAAYPAGSFVFARKFQGAVGPYGGQVFTGSRSGATITIANAPQIAFLNSGESNNVDYTSKYLGDIANDVVRGAVTSDPASVAPGGMTSISITTPGAKVGDFASVAPPYQIAGMQLTCYVSNNNEVTVILKNDTANPIDLVQGVWKSRVTQG